MPFTHKVQKGETLNQISNKYGFRNFREAGVKSVQSGNFDVIGIGEEVTLENYDPNKVTTSPTATPPVISSKDNAQRFQDDKAKLDSILAGAKDEEAPVEDVAKKDEPVVDVAKDVTVTTDESIIDDPLYTKSRLDDKAKIDTASASMETDKEDYLASISTRLADIDAVTASALSRIRLTSEKRIKEQERINQVNTDRVKAYGVGGSAIYKPIQFSDAVTERERKGAEKVNELERLRDQAITEAENFARLGKSELLTEKLEGLADIEDRLRTQLADIETESEAQYKLLRTLRKEKEDERLAKVKEVQDRLKAFVSLHKDEYKDLTPEEIEAKVTEVMKLSNLSYSEAYNAIIDGIQESAKEAKTKAETKKIKVQTRGEEADILRTKALTEKTKKETEAIGDDEDKFSTTQDQDLENAGLGDASRKQKLDFLRGEAKGDVTLYSEDDYANNADIGEIVIIGGQQYKKVGEDDYNLVQ